MSSSLVARDLQRIVIFVRECGSDAVIDGDSVVVLAPGKSHSEIATALADRHASRVRTLAEAWVVLDPDHRYAPPQAA
jgi:hypothetical protein